MELLIAYYGENNPTKTSSKDGVSLFGRALIFHDVRNTAKYERPKDDGDAVKNKKNIGHPKGKVVHPIFFYLHPKSFTGKVGVDEKDKDKDGARNTEKGASNKKVEVGFHRLERGFTRDIAGSSFKFTSFW